MNTLRLELRERSYNITVGRGTLEYAAELFDLNRKVFILTDSGVPKCYSEKIAALSKSSVIYTVQMGEGAKSMKVLEEVLSQMLDFGMTRSDALVAVGGGVVGDLGGFAAGSYMRGIDFYGVPTTLLSAVDSSIGGKCAVNLGSVKNVVGAFHQPRGVIFDPNVLKTLDKRQISNGIAEVVKMAACFDRELFERLEKEGFSEENCEEIVTASLMIKKKVVELDERESSLRKVLNFGHTLGHGIEAHEELCGLYHGECVALGMVPMIAENLRERLLSLLKKLGLPMEHKYDLEKALSFVLHDKKCKGGKIDAIFVPDLGEYKIENLCVSDFEKAVRKALKS